MSSASANRHGTLWRHFAPVDRFKMQSIRHRASTWEHRWRSTSLPGASSVSSSSAKATRHAHRRCLHDQSDSFYNLTVVDDRARQASPALARPHTLLVAGPPAAARGGDGVLELGNGP